MPNFVRKWNSLNKHCEEETNVYQALAAFNKGWITHRMTATPNK